MQIQLLKSKLELTENIGLLTGCNILIMIMVRNFLLFATLIIYVSSLYTVADTQYLHDTLKQQKHYRRNIPIITV